MVQNGGSPYVIGMTDAAGNLSITVQETDADVGDYYQTWYVGGVALESDNANPRYFSWAAALPSFSVAAGALPSSPPVLGEATISCRGPSNVTATWMRTPASHEYTTSYGASVPNAAAQDWNAVRSKVRLEYSSKAINILVEDASLPANVCAETALYNQAYPPCYNDTDICNGACAPKPAAL